MGDHIAILLQHLRLVRVVLTKCSLNLEVKNNIDSTICHHSDKMDFGRIIFYSEDVDKLYSRFTNDASISELVSFEK